MPEITFMPSGKRIEVPTGSLLFDAAKTAEVSVSAPCGGHGICGKCLVKILSGRVDFKSSGQISEEMLQEGFVLICKTLVMDEPICVQIISHLEMEQGKFSSFSEDFRLIDERLLPPVGEIEPLVKQTRISLLPPEQCEGLSDYDRLKNAILEAVEGRDIQIPLQVLRDMPDTLRQEEDNILLTYFEQNKVISVVDLGGMAESLGLAVDIGTTTVAVQLVVMATGRVLASKTDYNAQIECGLDVISRINYAKTPNRLEELRKKVLTTINQITCELCEKLGVSTTQIHNASIAGNTTMVHLLLGIVPQYIRLEPYTPALYAVPFFSAGEIGLDIHPGTVVYMAPAVGSYVGGDITSGLLCTDLCTDKEEVSLFIDIGTNGELVLGNGDFLLGCACSAGPAFEGGGIEHGMRASVGAIEDITVDEKTGKSVFSTIGQAEPIGICGSGIIALISQLFLTGWIDAAGKLNRTKPCEYIIEQNKNAKYIITKEGQDGKEIVITEADIDNFIRAKAAIFSACHTLIEKIEMDFGSLSKIYIAGGFGRFLNIEYAKTIGLIPNLDEEKFHFIGNSSILGAYMTLISKKHREKQAEVAARITYIDLSGEPDYMNRYTAALFLPHTDLRLFE